MRYVWSILILPILVITLGFALVALVPVGSAHAAPAVDTLPACIYEDGSGQALCMWDASEQGNGIGTDVVAGDCSYDTVGSMDASNACLTLWAMGERTTYLADGAVSVTSKGSVLVADCLSIEWEASQDKSIREALNNEGWNLSECFKAHIE
jgi:hypothetical protein